jgi:hypothetical protein
MFISYIMRNTRPVNVSLDLESYARIERLQTVFGGAVASFARVWTTDLSKLTPDQLRELKNIVEEAIRKNSLSGKAW